MDQPYSRIADALLDRQFWSPEDPQKHPYDDTGWSLGPLFGVDTARILDTAILKAPMHLVDDPTAPSSTASLSGDTFLIENHADPSLITLRYQLAHATITATDAAMTSGGHAYPAGTWIVRGVSAADLEKAAAPLHLHVVAASDLPSVATHPVAAPRIALMHTWLDTQPEGWWRLALDNLHIPYTYISTQTVAAESDLRAKYDVILFAPVGRSSQLILSGIPMWGNAMPWQKSDLTPNLGRIDSTPDIRPGLGEAGLAHLRDFIQQGGLFIASQDAAEFAIDTGLAPGVSVAPPGEVKVVGTILNTALVTKKDAAPSPVLAGYSTAPAVYSEDGMAFNVSNLLTGDRRLRAEAKTPRPTGRGGPDDPDVPQDRSFAEPPPTAQGQALGAHAAHRGADAQQSLRHPGAGSPAGAAPLCRLQGPAGRRPARPWRLAGRARCGRRRAPGQRHHAALRQQPTLSRRDDRQLCAGHQRDPRLSAAEVSRRQFMIEYSRKGLEMDWMMSPARSSSGAPPQSSSASAGRRNVTITLM